MTELRPSDFPYTLQLSDGPRLIHISTVFSTRGARNASIAAMVHNLRRAYDDALKELVQRFPSLSEDVEAQWPIILAPTQMQAAAREIITRIAVYIDASGAIGSPTAEEIDEGMTSSTVAIFAFIILSRFNYQMREARA